MRSTIRIALLGCAAVAVCAGAAFAQMEAPPPPDMPGAGAEHAPGRMADRFLDEFDLNHDGKVTHDEFNRTLAAHFAQIAGKSGSVSEDQFIGAHLKDLRARSDAMFRRLDWNGDGRLSLDEFLEPARARFEIADRDGTGTIPCAVKQQAAYRSDGGEPHRRAGGGFRGRGNLCAKNDLNEDGKLTRAELDKSVSIEFSGAAKGGSLNADQFYGIMVARFRDAAGKMFDRADSDHDGKLTLAEFAAREEKLFARLDKNGDGVITRDELSSSRRGRGFAPKKSG
ncbi:MAG TPA: EF-hand domain-containing protein [Rhizomicrobium sp.]|jgi:Ca2+-binding EF-hand superfamily protein|nr:EF-hand domain-containing protein [Rhizomicrobium sp.]